MPCRTAPSFARSIVTGILVVLLATMIVRDLLVRRWGSQRAPQTDVTRPSHDIAKISPGPCGNPDGFKGTAGKRRY